MTKSQTHSARKWCDLGGDTSQQMAATVSYFLVRPVGFSLTVVINGCVVQEVAGKSKACGAA